MNVLTEFQTHLLKKIGESKLKDSFFLTGGSALSAFYIQHRLSDDLDFFTEEEAYIKLVPQIMKEITNSLSVTMEISRSFTSFIEIFITKDKEIVRCDFAWDSPYRLKDKVYQKDYDIFVDNPLDIACNKLSALFDRKEVKDFVDIYFIDRELFKFEEILPKAKEKHIGIDNYWLAVSMKNIYHFDKLPYMIKPVTLEELRTFYTEKVKYLMGD